MIEVHLYGCLRDLVPGSTASEDTITRIEPVEGDGKSLTQAARKSIISPTRPRTEAQKAVQAIKT